ncbi:RNA polymerase sigma factor [Bacillus coahuilensis]|uniref:RNA polymerase sigma factor n=1 Tax=Bacillus coahuilensis TaxID=408580 RepID=UPI0001850D06|nr:RNA polymerase sigma factor [Bacillus coahuilensis]
MNAMKGGTEVNERNLITQMKQGNTDAFKILYEEHVEYALRIASTIMKDHAAAPDVVQESFIKVYKNIHQFEVDRPFKPWFYQILLNECRRHMKKHKRVIPTELNENRDLPQCMDRYYVEEYESLYQAVQQLADHQRIPIILKYIEDLTEKQIAEILELNINTIKSRLFKGRKKLKYLLSQRRDHDETQSF